MGGGSSPVCTHDDKRIHGRKGWEERGREVGRQKRWMGGVEGGR